jgi:hypothetical protein
MKSLNLNFFFIAQRSRGVDQGAASCLARRSRPARQRHQQPSGSERGESGSVSFTWSAAGEGEIQLVKQAYAINPYSKTVVDALSVHE